VRVEDAVQRAPMIGRWTALQWTFVYDKRLEKRPSFIAHQFANQFCSFQEAVLNHIESHPIALLPDPDSHDADDPAILSARY